MIIDMTQGDALAVEAFSNFLHWAGRPSRKGETVPGRRLWPPAVWGYALGFTPWCPPIGEW